MSALHAEHRRLILETMASKEGRELIRELFAELVKDLPAAASADDTVSVEEAAKIKNVTARTIGRWMKNGRIAVRRQGRSVRILKAAL